MNRLRKQSKVLPLVLAAIVAYSTSASAAEWQEGATYTAGTTVTYNGHTYQALQTHTAYAGAGWTPSSTPTLWKDLGASGGTPSPAPAPAPAPAPTPTPTPTPTPAPTPTACFAAWSATQVYANAGSRVTYNGRNYQNKWWTQGENPAQSGQYGVWQRWP